MTPKINSLHHRLRHLSDHLVEEEMRVYHEIGIDIPYRWHAILQIFYEYDKILTISDLAELQGKTHPDVVYTINQMNKEGLVIEKSDKSDKRKRIVGPSEKAKSLITTLRPSWQAAQDATNQWVKESAPDLWLNFESLNHALETRSFFSRIKKERKRSDLKNVQLVRYNEVQDAQLVLQNSWSQFKNKYFDVVELDKYIHDMQFLITKNEAETYFALWMNQIVGSISILRRSFKYCEIILLWIEEPHRRRYIATKLLEKGISLGREMGASNLFVQSHPKLVAANALFQNLSFITTEKYPASTVEYQSMTMLLGFELN
ncbi:MAG: bifunctional helix-turn-helix transcriptional regulator/GNAT family N-acetyltransferase [Saprospiraceae bacterium]